MSIIDNLNLLYEEIPQNVSLVAVSKTKTNSEILQAYNAGQKIFGENKALELNKVNVFMEKIKYKRWSQNGKSFLKIFSGI